MTKIVSKKYRWLVKKSYVFQLTIFYLLANCTLLLFPIIIAAKYLLNYTVTAPVDGPHATYFRAFFVAPLLETLIYQHLVYKIIKYLKFKKHEPEIYIIVSAVIFGGAHTYSLNYMVFAFTIGLVYAIIYYLYRRDFTKAFFSTALIHSSRNITATIASQLIL